MFWFFEFADRINVIAMNGLLGSIDSFDALPCRRNRFYFPVAKERKRRNKQNQIKASEIKSSLILLGHRFIATINSGLMYQVINPTLEHLTGLVSWYGSLISRR